MRRVPSLLLLACLGAAGGCDNQDRAGTSNVPKGGSGPVDANSRSGSGENPKFDRAKAKEASWKSPNPAPPMPEERFWSIIAAARADGRIDRADIMTALKSELMKLSADELDAFSAQFDTVHMSAYRWDLWAAAYIMDGGCGDDGFIDFRSWLISCGRSIFERALAEPDSLAEVPESLTDHGVTFEEFAYVKYDVYERVGPPEGGPRARPKLPDSPLGEEFDFDDPAIMRAKFPKLTRKHRV
ncbi:MAG: DUF4240 domain-containing protein [Tepidisphaera sp.]